MHLIKWLQRLRKTGRQAPGLPGGWLSPRAGCRSESRVGSGQVGYERCHVKAETVRATITAAGAAPIFQQPANVPVELLLAKLKHLLR